MGRTNFCISDEGQFSDYPTGSFAHNCLAIISECDCSPLHVFSGAGPNSFASAVYLRSELNGCKQRNSSVTLNYSGLGKVENSLRSRSARLLPSPKRHFRRSTTIG
ncbi:hypothetical protein niasHS_013656 [Heterodera schachtii]|uniref:Uncharacterized protein n=1 Tax=Heterodera schachtii TaxID=97005 RepID=A0ABD2IMH0_HETSC